VLQRIPVENFILAIEVLLSDSRSLSFANKTQRQHTNLFNHSSHIIFTASFPNPSSPVLLLCHLLGQDHNTSVLIVMWWCTQHFVLRLFNSAIFYMRNNDIQHRFRITYLKFLDNNKEINHISDSYLHSRLHMEKSMSFLKSHIYNKILTYT
jgi:hypothetical protein